MNIDEINVAMPPGVQPMDTPDEAEWEAAKEDNTKTRKPILSMDFDGVIHSYTSGWKGAGVLPDPPVDGAMQFLRDAIEHYEVHICSSRSSSVIGRQAMRKYLWVWATHQLPFDDAIMVWNRVAIPYYVKPPALVTIDDRAMRFLGTFPEMAVLKSYGIPWNKG